MLRHLFQDELLDLGLGRLLLVDITSAGVDDSRDSPARIVKFRSGSAKAGQAHFPRRRRR